MTTPTEEGGALPPTDADVIASAREDPRAFAALFDRHYDAIAGFLRRRVAHALADELAAETFLQAYAARDRYDLGRVDARPWLYGIAANLLRRHWRSEVRRLRADARAAADGEHDAGLDAVEDRLDASAAAPAVARALASLGPGERDALLLHAWTDLTYEQLAEALDVPVGTVRSRIHRARRAVRELLAGCGEAEGEPTAETALAGGEEIR